MTLGHQGIWAPWRNRATSPANRVEALRGPTMRYVVALSAGVRNKLKAMWPSIWPSVVVPFWAQGCAPLGLGPLPMRAFDFVFALQVSAASDACLIGQSGEGPTLGFRPVCVREGLWPPLTHGYASYLARSAQMTPSWVLAAQLRGRGNLMGHPTKTIFCCSIIICWWNVARPGAPTCC